MKDLLICLLAMTWVLGVIRQMGTRRYPRETADHIDRDFREMVAKWLRPCPARLHHATLSGCNCQVYRRASLSDGIKSTTLGYSDDDGKTWFTKPEA